MGREVLMSGKEQDFSEGKGAPVDSSGGGKASEPDDVPGKGVVDKAMEYCRSRQFLRIFEEYIRDNAWHFYGEPKDQLGLAQLVGVTAVAVGSGLGVSTFALLAQVAGERAGDILHSPVLAAVSIVCLVVFGRIMYLYVVRRLEQEPG